MPKRFLPAWPMAMALPLAVGAAAAAPIVAARPMVIELFQSQGCSSCPPANALLNAIADRPEVLALSFAVTYWDQLGWTDSFGSPRFTARQQAYAAAGRGEVATPEFIIDGSDAVLGSDPQAFASAMARAGRLRTDPAMAPPIAANRQILRLGHTAAASPATVWLVRYDHGIRNVPVRAGENRGRTLPHRNVVRDLVRLGVWSGAAANFMLPAASEPGLAGAILIQRGPGGPIIAASRI